MRALLGETLWSRQQSRLGNSLSAIFSRHIDYNVIIELECISNSVSVIMSSRVGGHAVNLNNISCRQSLWPICFYIQS